MYFFVNSQPSSQLTHWSMSKNISDLKANTYKKGQNIRTISVWRQSFFRMLCIIIADHWAWAPHSSWMPFVALNQGKSDLLSSRIFSLWHSGDRERQVSCGEGVWRLPRDIESLWVINFGPFVISALNWKFLVQIFAWTLIPWDI